MSQFPPGDSVPYASYLPPPKLRPTSVTVIAIIAIVFGSISLLTALCGISGLIMNATGASNAFMMNASSSTTTVTGPTGTTTTTYTTSANPGAAMTQKMNAFSRDPVLIAGNVVSIPLKIILAIIEIWAATGLLGLKPAGRAWITRYAVADIFLSVAVMIFTVVVVQPRMTALLQSMAQSPSAPSGSAQMMTASTQLAQVGVYGGLVFSVLLLAWPICILYFMTRPLVKAAFGELQG